LWFRLQKHGKVGIGAAVCSTAYFFKHFFFYLSVRAYLLRFNGKTVFILLFERGNISRGKKIN
jgi:hypothetical protein